MISIVVPTYNRINYIGATLESIIQQKIGADLEVIVVDDGSTDDTDNFLKVNYPEIRILRQNNRGVSSARNFGVKNAKYDYVAFCDSDDLMLPGRLAVQYEFLKKNSAVVMVAGNFLDFNSDEGVARECRFNHEMLGINKGCSGVAKNFLKNCTMVGNPLFSTGMFRKSTFLDSGGFAENIRACEDFELRARIATLGDIGIIDKPLMLIRNDNQNRISRGDHKGNPYELMVDQWLLNHSALINTNMEFRSHVRQWIGHVVMQKFSSGDLSEFNKLYKKYKRSLPKKYLVKCCLAFALLAIRKRRGV